VSESSAWDDLDAPVPATVTVRGVSVGVGHRVRLQPLAGGDVMDIALAGRLAVVESIDVTTEGEPRFVVTIDDDPGRDLGGRRYPAHRFFFRSEEIEPLVERTSDGREAGGSARVRVLVAGIGNIFFGDDGFGVAAARRLAKEAWPAGVVVRDFGIRGLDLAYALQEDFDAAVLIDALARGGEPGTLHVLEPDLEADAIGDTLDAHVMDPVRVLRLAEALGRLPPRIIVVGCEPLSIEGRESLADELVALSPPVRDAVERAAGVLKTIIRNLTSTELHRAEDKDDVNSGLGLGDRRDRRGHPDHLGDSHANPPNAPVLSHEGDVVRP
jgi:hydrogenase maturation protease